MRPVLRFQSLPVLREQLARPLPIAQVARSRRFDTRAATRGRSRAGNRSARPSMTCAHVGSGTATAPAWWCWARLALDAPAAMAVLDRGLSRCGGARRLSAAGEGWQDVD